MVYCQTASETIPLNVASKAIIETTYASEEGRVANIALGTQIIAETFVHQEVVRLAEGTDCRRKALEASSRAQLGLSRSIIIITSEWNASHGKESQLPEVCSRLA
jgi:hypothetical protein